MSFDRVQFRDLVARTLTEADLCSDEAIALLLGTAAVESQFGTYLRQIGGGPAVGVFQMEPATFIWLQTGCGRRFPEIIGRRADHMEWDLRLSILMARLRYLMVQESLPTLNPVALGTYWKRYYNTAHGRGTVEQFVTAYGRYVK